MEKIKILHISQATGGVKTYVASAMKFADKALFEFAVVAPANDHFQHYCSAQQVPYYSVDLNRGFNPFKNFRELMQIITAIRKEQPTIIHTHSAKAGMLGRIAAEMTGAKIVVYTPHAFSYLSFIGIKRMIFYSLELLARKWTTCLLAISYSEAAKAIFELGFEKKKIKVILNAIAVPPSIPAKNPHSEINIRMIGRLTAQKNLFLFLEIANRLSKRYAQVRFCILGAGIHDDLSNEITHYIHDNKLNDCVTIESWGDETKSLKFLAQTDIYLMTSVFEGLPYALLEAMALAIPCVVSRVDGNNDVIHNNENGYSCLTVDDFCDKIELLIEDEQLREQVGIRGYESIKKDHDILKTSVELALFYKYLLN